MTTPSKQLADLVCDALFEAKIIGAAQTDQFKAQVMSGKTKPEDWLMLIENSEEAATQGAQDGE